MRRVAAASLIFFAGLAHEAIAAERPEVVIDPGGVPPEALQAINGAVEAITRLAEDQDGGEVARLRRRAHDATVSALETQGYFSPVVTLEVGEDIGGETWDITIEPGERARVGDVDLAFSGQIARPEFKTRLIGLRKGWPLTEGMVFINSKWSDAKTSLLDDVSRHDFYFAKYASTRATVDAEAARADLAVNVDSGPRVLMGPLSIHGLKRVPASLIDRYIQYAPGDPYDQDKMDEWQQSLQSTSFFRGAFVTLNQDEAARKTHDDGSVELPVRVDVSEAPARRFSTSIGADSDHGPRIEGVYRQNVVFGQPVWIETGAGVTKTASGHFSTCISRPRSAAIRTASAYCTNTPISRVWITAASAWAQSVLRLGRRGATAVWTTSLNGGWLRPSTRRAFQVRQATRCPRLPAHIASCGAMSTKNTTRARATSSRPILAPASRSTRARASRAPACGLRNGGPWAGATC
jgi:translocation and assembly module TamA